MPRTNPPLTYGELKRLLLRAGFEFYKLRSNKAMFRHPSGVHVRFAMQPDGKCAGGSLTDHVRRVIHQAGQHPDD